MIGGWNLASRLPQNMQYQTRIWTIELGTEVIATITMSGYDFPWIHGELTNARRFEQYRDYFTDPDGWPDTPEFDAMIKKINSMGDFKLHDLLSGEKHTSFILNQEGGHVWFRY